VFLSGGKERGQALSSNLEVLVTPKGVPDNATHRKDNGWVRTGRKLAYDMVVKAEK